MKFAATYMHWSQPLAAYSLSKRPRNGKNTVLVCHVVNGSHRSALFGRTLKSVSCEIPKSRTNTSSLRIRRRGTSNSLDSLSDEEFAENIDELALRFQLSNNYNQSDDDSRNNQGDERESPQNYNSFNGSNIGFTDSTGLRIRPQPPYEAIPVSVERKAKKKTEWSDELKEVGESAYCSVIKAFSSMVFIISELQSYTIQMREFLFFEDVQGILDRVQKEMNASFVWLFQQIFSHTPILMVYVMILMANFTVHSMSNNAALATTPPPTVEYYSLFENHNKKSIFDSLSSGKTISIGGNSGGGGGGGKVKPIGTGTDGGDGRFDGVSSIHHHTIIPDELSQLSTFVNQEEDSIQQVEETTLWNSIVEEASKLQSEIIDHETMQTFVSPIIAEIEAEDYSVYSKTELNYQEAVSEEPNNPLLLTNYAQFLYLVVHDHDRAEELFKRASDIKPSDAEALSKYASFLWMARKEINEAEETYLEAIEADPGNSFYAAIYANFLWNTGICGNTNTYTPLKYLQVTLHQTINIEFSSSSHADCSAPQGRP